MSVEVGYLPGLAMRRIADLYPGEGKTDARDAFVIADAARTLPQALRRVGTDEQTVVALGVLAGYDADLAAESTRLTNRLHAALLHRIRRWNAYWANISVAAVCSSSSSPQARQLGFVSPVRMGCGRPWWRGLGGWGHVAGADPRRAG